MAKTIGRPVKVDPISLSKTFCHYARVQVDVDLQFSLPPKVLIEREDLNFELHISYESLPAFCTHCCTIGHFVGDCRNLKKMQEDAAKNGNGKDHNPKSTAKHAQQPVHKQKNQSSHPISDKKKGKSRGFY